jgi:Periplasmic binding protein
MFASDLGSLNPTLPVNTLEGKILKEVGGSVLGAYRYSISPSSSRVALATKRSFEHAGGTEDVLDTSLAFGTMDFTSEALIAKQHHVNALFPTMIDSSNFALARALKQAGGQVKAAVFATGYDSAVIHSPVWPYLLGDYFLSIYVRSRCPTRAPARWRPRSSATNTSPRANSPPCSNTRLGPARIS